jgi:hypothetical protein
MQRWPVLARQCCQTYESGKFSARSGFRGDKVQRTRLDGQGHGSAREYNSRGYRMPSLWELRGVYRYVGMNKCKRWSCYRE